MANDKEMAFIHQAVAYTGDNCLTWPFRLDQWGRPMVQLSKDIRYGKLPPLLPRSYYKDHHRTRQYSTAVVVLTDTGRPRPSASYIPTTTCGNIACICPQHLLWKHRKVLRTKLSPEQQAAIVASHERSELLAVKYNVSFGLISRIRRAHVARAAE